MFSSSPELIVQLIQSVLLVGIIAFAFYITLRKPASNEPEDALFTHTIEKILASPESLQERNGAELALQLCQETRRLESATLPRRNAILKVAEKMGIFRLHQIEFANVVAVLRRAGVSNGTLKAMKGRWQPVNPAQSYAESVKT